MKKIMIVEDEVIVAIDLKMSLENVGYTVTDCVINLDTAKKSILKNKPDLVLMDINLNSVHDGTEIARIVYDMHLIPVIYLTAYHDNETIKKAVKTNPMGYLNKPFKINDLITTIEVAFYKIEQLNKEVNKEFFELTSSYFFDTENEILYYNRTVIKLSIREKELLKMLILAKGNIVTFGTIEYLLWTDSIASSSIRTLLYRLRSKLEFNIIETIPSIGCRIKLP